MAVVTHPTGRSEHSGSRSPSRVGVPACSKAELKIESEAKNLDEKLECEDMRSEGDVAAPEQTRRGGKGRQWTNAVGEC